MPQDMTLWSYVTQWVGYLAWCASASDPTCRPFVGFLAMAGASAGALSMLVLGLVGMLNGWEREILTARASAAQPQSEPRQNRRAESPRAEPALAVGVATAYAGHAEPLLSAATATLGAEPEGLRAVSPIAVPLRQAL